MALSDGGRCINLIWEPGVTKHRECSTSRDVDTRLLRDGEDQISQAQSRAKSGRLAAEAGRRTKFDGQNGAWGAQSQLRNGGVRAASKVSLLSRDGTVPEEMGDPEGAADCTRQQAALSQGVLSAAPEEDVTMSESTSSAEQAQRVFALLPEVPAQEPGAATRICRQMSTRAISRVPRRSMGDKERTVRGLSLT